MALSTQPYKGARDFYPEKKRIQDYMFSIMRQVAKSYGYEEYDAPILESLELYKAKSGEEIVNEQTYTFTDRGGREVVIRPEMTPTVSRMVAAKRQELAYPLRWFSIPNLWRYERPQRGRLREHWQLNVDIFGEAGLAADHEIISVADSILKAYGADSSMYDIRINSRQLINTLFTEYLKLDESRLHQLIKLIDRMAKLPPEKVQVALAEICTGLDQTMPEKIMKLLQVKTLDELPVEYHTNASYLSLQELLNTLDKTGITNARFDITLMRGFDYYTDIVFEVFDNDPENNRAMFGGGRYDGLVGLFGVEPVPTVGFGMGDVTLANFLESHDLLPTLTSSTDVVMVQVGPVTANVSNLAQTLRRNGLNVAVDATDRKIDKKIKAADKLGVQYVLFVGEDELAKQVFTLKNLHSGEEKTLTAAEITSFLSTET